MEKTVTIDELREAVTIVFHECEGNLPIKFKVRENAEELYGYETVKNYPRLKNAQGAYLPNGDHRGRDRGQNYIYLQSSTIFYNERRCGEGEKSPKRNQGVIAALPVVRHEVLGHYALNTCSAEQKKNILETIIKHKQEPDLKRVWDNLGEAYIAQPMMTQAEEVFCFVAENKSTLDVNFDLSSQPFTLKHVEQIAARIAEGIRLGERTQQIFPANNQAQFYQQESRQKPLDLTQHYTTDYHWSSSDKKMMLTINGQPPTVINERVLSQIAKRDKFLSCYDVATLRTGKLDLRVAQGEQPVPKTYDGRGEAVSQSEPQQAMKLK
ncbi:hypothetical protein A6E00_08575 [Vibrio diabolicus]|uniref:IncP-type DNA transfer primase TraC n=1 Tax=Vibrio sp. FF_273 TaxID=1652830 RepID=A0A0H4A1P3_9VIBR|nr:hypothetical protein [Vibrio diabolicus]AKN40872.1 IncP-type DNA transfer primase TraC [Vibrio sp. FF_273]OCH69558.1 hypothetical protein A6E00_08575 [Vibrio diabolicus]